LKICENAKIYLALNKNQINLVEANIYIPLQLKGIASMIWEQKSNSSQRWKILPSGYIELIFNLGEKMEDLSGKKVGQSFNPTENFCFLSGLHTQPLCMTYSQFHVMGVRLEPVAAKSLFKIPCFELKDWALKGEEIFHNKAYVEDAIRSFSDFQLRAKWLEQYLYALICENPELYLALKISKLLKQVADYRKIGTPVKLEDFTGYSRMHTYRLFKDWFGLSPSYSISLQQFISSVNAIHTQHESLTHLAFDHGFYDSSHFIRIFRQYAEMTPGQYLQQKSNLIGQFPC